MCLPSSAPLAAVSKGLASAGSLAWVLTEACWACNDPAPEQLLVLPMACPNPWTLVIGAARQSWPFPTLAPWTDPPPVCLGHHPVPCRVLPSLGSCGLVSAEFH